MHAKMPYFVSSFLSASNHSPTLIEADIAVRASLGTWSRINNDSPVLAYAIDNGFGPRGFGYRVSVNAPDSRTRYPRGEGLGIVDAYRDFVRAIWTDIAAMEAELDACDAANAAEDAALAAAAAAE